MNMLQKQNWGTITVIQSYCTELPYLCVSNKNPLQNHPFNNYYL